MPKQGPLSVLSNQGHGQVMEACLCCSWSRLSQPGKDTLILISSSFPEKTYLPDWPTSGKLVERCVSPSDIGASLVLSTKAACPHLSPVATT